MEISRIGWQNNIKMTLESLYIEYDVLRLDLRGISPKLSLHASMTRRMEEIKARIDAAEAERKAKNLTKKKNENNTIGVRR